MVTKASKAEKAKARIKKGDAYECGVCGYRIIVDEVCGCAEEHVFVCCNKKMKKATKK
jgi:rubrerythrin